MIGFTSVKSKADAFFPLGAAPSSLSPGPLLIEFITTASFFKASNWSEDKVKKLVLPFHHVGPRGHKQVIRKNLHPVSNPTGLRERYINPYI